MTPCKPTAVEPTKPAKATTKAKAAKELIGVQQAWLINAEKLDGAGALAGVLRLPEVCGFMVIFCRLNICQADF